MSERENDRLPSEAEVFRTMHDLLEGIAQIAENHGFKRGDDLQVWLARNLPASLSTEPMAKEGDWVLVPREPTTDMIAAAFPYEPDDRSPEAIVRDYRAMIAASPAPAQQEGAEFARAPMEVAERLRDRLNGHPGPCNLTQAQIYADMVLAETAVLAASPVAPSEEVTDAEVEAAARLISPNCMWDAGYVNGHIERRRDNARMKARAALLAALQTRSNQQ